MDRGNHFQPVTYAYSLRLHRLAETTSSDLVVARHPSDLLITGATFQGQGTDAEGIVEPVQYKRVTPRGLRN